MDSLNFQEVSNKLEDLKTIIRQDNFTDGNVRLNYVNKELDEISIFAKSKGVPFHVSAYDLLNTNPDTDYEESSDYSSSYYDEDSF